jgi:hypothetical protein
MWTVARSISRPARARLNPRRRFVAQVLAVFEHACDLVTPDGDVVALVLLSIGDGPLNVVVDGAPGRFERIAPNAPATLDGDQLQVGALRVDLGMAAVWEPRPDWDTLRARCATITSRLPLLRDLCRRHAPPGTLLALLELSVPSERLNRTVLTTAHGAVGILREGWAGDVERLQASATGLAGLGGGLTPAGDDFLTGLMLWAWLAHPDPGSFCYTVAQIATPRTTTLASAFLRTAARGECSAPWHTLLAALYEGTEAQITAAVKEILVQGATSGADSLSGFLYLGT